MAGNDIVSRFNELKQNLADNFKILHTRLDQHEQEISRELDRVLNEMLERASCSEGNPQENDLNSELEQLGQCRNKLFAPNTKKGEVETEKANIGGDIHLVFDLTKFETALANMIQFENSLFLPEKEKRIVPFSGCSEGHLPGELNGPRGLSMDQNDNIYICDQYNKRIQIFSNTGQYKQHFGDEHLTGPWSIAVIGDNAYVTDAGQHGVYWFTVSDGKLVKKIGGKGADKGQFNVPHGIDVSQNGELFVCDCFNDRVSVLDTQLNFIKNQCELQIIRPDDVKVRDNIFIVLDSNDPCLHVFNLQGVKIHSLIQGVGEEASMTKWGYFFAITPENNLVIISDVITHSLRVYSIQGELLHTLGQVGTDKGEFMTPQGVGLLSDNRIVTVCIDKKCDMLQIF